MNDHEWLAQLRQFRLDNELTQHDLACFLGVSQRSVSRWEAGADMPSLSLRRRLAVLMGVGIGTGIPAIIEMVRNAPVPLGLVDGRANLLAASPTFSAVGEAIRQLQDDEYPAATVLVVEDNESALKATRAALKSWNYIAVGAPDGVVALRLVRRKTIRPSAAIIDFLLPGSRDGVDVGHELQEMIPGIPILIVSGDTKQQHLRKISQSGFPFISKPADPERIRLALIAMLSAGKSSDDLEKE